MTPELHTDRKLTSEPAVGSTVLLAHSDVEGTAAEIIRRLAGKRLPASNGWGDGEVAGAWKLKRPEETEPHVRLLLACPNAENPTQLFNEDSRAYCASDRGQAQPPTATVPDTKNV